MVLSRSINRGLLVAGLLMSGVLSVAAQSPQAAFAWRESSPEDEEFTVNFPAEPRMTTGKRFFGERQNNYKFHFYSVVTNNTLFLVESYEGDRPKDYDIWKVSRGADGKWGEPANLGPTVNTDKNEYYPSVAKNGNLYFTVEAPYGKGGEDIVVCKKTTGGYAAPESLPEAINSKTGEFNAFVDPDEQFIIFGAESRPGRVGSGDLYMSKKNNTGNWQPARQLPVPINSTGLDYCPYVTADKKYLIFTSNRLRKEWDSDKAVTFDEMKSLITEPGNGLDDIYWVKFNPDW